MWWTKEKIQKKKEYFQKERIEKKGKFTEFTVRTYYCIYASCSKNNAIYCKTSDVRAYKIKNIIYEGFYNNEPDHDNASVINDCIEHLKKMGYIKFKKHDEVWMIYLNKQLDFLLDEEHEFYIDKFNIENSLVVGSI